MRSKAYSFKCGTEKKKKFKGFFKSHSKSNNFEQYYNCLFGGEYQKGCDRFINHSKNKEMYLQKVRKSTQSAFDEKQWFQKQIDSTPRKRT